MEATMQDPTKQRDARMMQAVAGLSGRSALSNEVDLALGLTPSTIAAPGWLHALAGWLRQRASARPLSAPTSTRPRRRPSRPLCSGDIQCPEARDHHEPSSPVPKAKGNDGLNAVRAPAWDPHALLDSSRQLPGRFLPSLNGTKRYLTACSFCKMAARLASLLGVAAERRQRWNCDPTA